MKKVLLILSFLSIVGTLGAQISVTDFYAEPDSVGSGETFTFHATVVNNSDAYVDTEIYMRGMSDPDKGFHGIEEFRVCRYKVNMEGHTQKNITYEYGITTDDCEYFSFFWRDKDNEVISDSLTVQIGEFGTEVRRIEFLQNESYVFVDSIGNELVAIYPSSAPREVEWIFGDPSLVEIVEHYMDGPCPGIIYKGIAPGETTLTARTPNGLEATIPFVVYKNRKPAESISLNFTEIAGNVGDIIQLEATIEPDDIEDPLIFFVSRDEKVATVGIDDGEVKLVGPGSTEIVVWVSPGGAQTSCQVMVEPASGLHDIGVGQTADVYGIDGILLIHRADAGRINALPEGCYILRYPDRTLKLVK